MDFVIYVPKSEGRSYTFNPVFKGEVSAANYAEEFPDDIVMWVDAPTELDHKELLRKYMDHVLVCEGALFTNEFDRRYTAKAASVEFSDEEWAELQRIDKSLG